MVSMIWTGWTNGRNSPTGAGLGFVIEAADRDRYFKREWRTVAIELPEANGYSRAVANVDKDWVLKMQITPFQPRCHRVRNVRDSRGSRCLYTAARHPHSDGTRTPPDSSARY